VSTSTTDRDATYYAVLDPADHARMRYARRTTRGQLEVWPPIDRTRPGDREVLAAVESDPDAAAARFDALGTACCVCGRTLTDPLSKTIGIGPECRQDVGDTALAVLAEGVARQHAREVQ
jgi:hypothetical protein